MSKSIMQQRSCKSKIQKPTKLVKYSSRTCVESSTQTTNDELVNDSASVTKLIAQLSILLTDKSKLEGELDALKVENQEYEQKLQALHTVMLQNEHRWTENSKKIQGELKEKEIDIAEKDVKYLEERKKLLTEINTIKSAYNKRNEIFDKTERELLQKVKTLETDLNTLKDDSDKAIRDSLIYKQKSGKYKAKLKYAVSAVKEMNALMAEAFPKACLIDQECQTEVEEKNAADIASSCSVNAHYGLECENMVLSELFFRANPPLENLEPIFCNYMYLDDAM